MFEAFYKKCDSYEYNIIVTAKVDDQILIYDFYGYGPYSIFNKKEVLSSYQITFDIEYLTKFDLKEIFKDFKFHDMENVNNIDITIIEKQIKTYLSICKLRYQDFTLQFFSPTSVILKTEPSSELYQGKIVLSWN